jgi:hypothetical protein
MFAVGCLGLVEELVALCAGSGSFGGGVDEMACPDL